MRKTVEINSSRIHLYLYDKDGNPIKAEEVLKEVSKIVLQEPGLNIEITGMRKCPEYVYLLDVSARIKVFE